MASNRGCKEARDKVEIERTIQVLMKMSPEVLGLIDEVRHDRIHGASELARQAVSILKTAAKRSQADSVEQFLVEQKEIGRLLMSARPAMAPLSNIVNRLVSTVSEKAGEVELDSIRRFTVTQANELINDSLQAVAQIAEYSSELITGGERIMTHSYSSTVVVALKAAFTKHRDIEVITTGSDRDSTVERIAQELGLYGIAVTFIDDTAAGLYLPTVNRVVVGADRICADGKVVNGIGTCQLALAAGKIDIPCYVLCETLKFDPRLRGDEVDLEEDEPSEVVEPGRLPAEVRIKNPSFDVTPLELVTGIVTENGLLMPKEVIDYIGKLLLP